METRSNKTTERQSMVVDGWTEQLFMVSTGGFEMVQAVFLLLYTHIHIGAITGNGSTGDNIG